MARRLPTLLVLAGALMVVIVGTVPEEADAAGRFKKVIKNFRNTTSLRVPGPGFDSGPAEPYPSAIKASGFNRGRVRDVNLIFWNFTHLQPDDVDMVLVHRGVNRTVMSDVGGSFDVADINIILDDEAVPPLPDEGALSTNAWKPQNYQTPDSFPAPGPTQPNIGAELSGFDGTDPNGGWQLYAYDDNGNDITGMFAKGWTIQIKARVRR
jgi:hypothetical protein